MRRTRQRTQQVPKVHPAETSIRSFDFCTLGLNGVPRQCMHVEIELLGMRGRACLDSGARTSVTSQALYQKLKSDGMPFEVKRMWVQLADGHPKDQLLPTYQFPVEPNSADRFRRATRCKEQRDSLTNAPQRSCSFCDIPGDIHLFDLAPAGPLPSMDNAIGALQEETSPTGEDSLSLLIDQAFATADELIRIECKRRRDIDIGSVDFGLRSNDGVFLSPGERDELTALLAQFEDIFQLTGRPTMVAKHRINTGYHPPIAVPPYRLPPAKR